MDEILFDYLSQNVPAELFDLYRKAGGIIEAFELTENYSPLVDLIQTLDHNEPSNVNDLIHEVFVQTLESILSDFNIRLVEGYSLSDLVDVITNLLLLESTEFLEEVYDLTYNSEDANETLADCFALVSAMPADHWLVKFDRVSPALINRICDRSLELMNEQVEEVAEEDDIQTKVHENMKGILNTYALNTGEAVKDKILVNSYVLYFLSSIAIDLVPFKTLLTLVDEHVFSDDLELTAFNLFVIAANASDSALDPLGYLRENISEYLPNIEESRAVLEHARVIKERIK